MEYIFKGENILEFIKQFPDDTTCLETLSNLKWSEGFKCRKCGPPLPRESLRVVLQFKILKNTNIV